MALVVDDSPTHRTIQWQPLIAAIAIPFAIVGALLLLPFVLLGKKPLRNDDD